MNAAQVINRIKDAVGPRGWVSEPEAMAPYLTEPRGLYRGDAAMVVRPADTDEVATVVRLCAEAGLPIVPQGGNTSLCGGSAPRAGGGEILLSLSRMNRIRGLDRFNFSMIAEAGCVLADIHQAALGAGLRFPLNMASEGSCQIGGNLSTNAGGVSVLRYGNARDLVLGLEVVLPDGRIWEGPRSLRKDNTGYDIKQLFIGAEGTLGVITAAALKLFPKPREVVTSLLAVKDVASAIELFSRVRDEIGDCATAFELIPRIALDFALRHIPGTVDPMTGIHPWYVLVELTSSATRSVLREALEDLLEAALAKELVRDGVIAESQAQALSLWRLRESIPEAQKFEGGSIKHDVSVPIAAMARFIDEACAAVSHVIPGCRPVVFGHVGDGNAHFNVSQPPNADSQAFLGRWDEINRIVHDMAVVMGGSFSAEHGVGRLKLDQMERYKSPVELDVMRAVKQSLDPQGIMNPGKVLR
ncbi:MAG: FAD-binding oxidoreductase [Sphingomonadales bacterium]